jgi:endoglucanase
MNANERQYSNPKTEVGNAADLFLICVYWRSFAADADRAPRRPAVIYTRRMAKRTPASSAPTSPPDAERFDLLDRLCATPGVPGREHRVRDLIRGEIAGLFDEVAIDPMGSIIAIRKPRKKTPGKPVKVMLAAHMDQIGFLVRHLDDKGFLRVNPVGGFDTRNLFARLVTVCPDVNDPARDLAGVMNPGGKPIHIADEADKSKVPKIEEFVVDLGLSPEEVKKQVKIGDMVVLRAPFAHVGAMLVGQALDNRVACWIVIEALRKLVADKTMSKHACEIHCVFTVQEEVGLRGAFTSAYAVKPDVGIAIDTTLCVDTPGVTDDQRVTKQGDGAALTVMDGASIADLALLEAFERTAVAGQIPHQRSILPRGGTDSAAMQRAGAGVRTFTLSCPTRYIHTVTEAVHRVDVRACRDLLAAYLAQA